MDAGPRGNESGFPTGHSGRAGLHLSVFSVVVVAVLAGLFIPLAVRDRVARFWGLGVLLSLVPIAAVGPENRLLGFVGFGVDGTSRAVGTGGLFAGTSARAGSPCLEEIFTGGRGGPAPPSFVCRPDGRDHTSRVVGQGKLPDGARDLQAFQTFRRSRPRLWSWSIRPTTSTS